LFTGNSKLKRINDHAFSETHLKRIVIPVGVLEIGEVAFPDQCRVLLHEKENCAEMIQWQRKWTHQQSVGLAFTRVEGPQNADETPEEHEASDGSSSDALVETPTSSLV
jgi:hypothetical protein